MDEPLPLVRDVLDKQIVDPDKCKIGKVDGLILQARANRPPRVIAMEVSQSAAWRRLYHRLGDFADWLRAKFEPGQNEPPRPDSLVHSVPQCARMSASSENGP